MKDMAQERKKTKQKEDRRQINKTHQHGESKNRRRMNRFEQ